MNATNAKSIIDTLLAGADPQTGEALPANTVVNSVSVRAALVAAAEALADQASRAKGDRKIPAHAGLPWSADEDDRLSAAFRRGASLSELIEAHKRTAGAIKSRLMRLGLLVADDALLPSTAVPDRAADKIDETPQAPIGEVHRSATAHTPLLEMKNYVLGVSRADIFRNEELRALRRYGFWLEALAEGRIAPTTPAQEQFCRVARGEEKAKSVYERAWMRLVGRREIEPELVREFEMRDPGEDWFKREAHWRYQ